jgi:TatA/E family protein of Tat protein translocase
LLIAPPSLTSFHFPPISLIKALDVFVFKRYLKTDFLTKEPCMFGIGMPEMIVILAVALIVIGPKKLPDLAKSLGRAMNEFRRATNEIKSSLEVDEEIKDIKKDFYGINDEFKYHGSKKESPASSKEEPEKNESAKDE